MHERHITLSLKQQISPLQQCTLNASNASVVSKEFATGCKTNQFGEPWAANLNV